MRPVRLSIVIIYYGRMKAARGAPSSGSDRSQTEVLGFMLVFSIVIVGALLVLALGITAIDSTEEELSDSRAENTLTQFDSAAALVALEETDVQRMSFPVDAGEQYRVRENRGRMIVTIENLTSGTSEEVMNLTLGAVTYEDDGVRLAYQGGGVWRDSERGGQMVSPPEFHYRNGTLTLPAVSVTGDSNLGSTAVIRHSSSTAAYPTALSSQQNPLERHRVKVTVQSEFYRGWGRYFSDRTDGDVEYFDDDNEVTVTLVTPVNVDEVKAASASLSAGGKFHVAGSSNSDCDAAKDAYTDSYDSSKSGSYCDQWNSDDPPGNQGDIIYGKDVDISDGSGGSNFYGDIESGTNVTVEASSGSGQPTIYGNISYVDRCGSEKNDDPTICEDRINESSGGEVRQIDGILLTESVDWFIETATEEIREAADSPHTNPDVEGETLTAGEYYMDTLHLSKDSTLKLDTTDGDVIMAVDSTVILNSGANIEVLGEGHAELYILGDGVSGDHLFMDNNASITNDDQAASRFRLFGTKDMNATLGGGGGGGLARFQGVIYAPPGSTGNGTVYMNGAEIFGGLLTGTTRLDGGSIHYDEALQGKSIVPENARVIRVTYLHVTENRITIESN